MPQSWNKVKTIYAKENYMVVVLCVRLELVYWSSSPLHRDVSLIFQNPLSKPANQTEKSTSTQKLKTNDIFQHLNLFTIIIKGKLIYHPAKVK